MWLGHIAHVKRSACVCKVRLILQAVGMSSTKHDLPARQKPHSRAFPVYP
jgi:hypothetical protein